MKNAHNGKYRYFYDRTELQKYEQNKDFLVDVRKNPDGATHHQYNAYTLSNDLLNSTMRITTSNGYGTSATNYHKLGKLGQTEAEIEEWVYNKILKPNSTVNKTLASIENTINNGRKAITDFFGRLKK